MITSIERNRQVVSRLIGNQAIVVPIAGTGSGAAAARSVYSFNESGTKLWSLIEAGKTVGDLAASLSSDYGLPASEAARDAQDFLARLASEGLIELAESIAPAPAGERGASL